MASSPDGRGRSSVGVYDRPSPWRRPWVWVAAAAVVAAGAVAASFLLT